MSDIGIGVVGSGFMGRTYSETLSKYCTRGRLKAVAAGSRAGQLAEDYAMDLEPSFEALIARQDIDAVFIATPHHVHAEQAIAAAGAGKHVLIEKPMACTVAECDAILDACRKNNVHSSIAFTQRMRICNMRAKRIIADDRIGGIQQIASTQLNGGGVGTLPKWQSEVENLGTLFGHGIHNFDSIRWLTGQEIKTVYAKCGSFEPGLKVEGTSMVVMSMSGGAFASLWSSFQMPRPSFPRAQFAARIVGERGLIDLDAYGELRLSVGGGPWEVVETQAPIDWQGKGFLDPVRLESYTRQCQDFIDACIGNRPPLVTGWDGRQAVAAALAAYESARSGKEVVLA
ncbi:MAG TPA: Gfo/Idh/MocA family oxidoreductase [Phycisphaerae bacterium]|nr:Gfo/Idh/MocA family oxidoreductase [Phycisphaerae bacterium]HRY66604.1 Gfo/Idh/MocA family oxidoreductase [Phycisphaerae bacterium]HSA27024.1 Gfo/Idh/MocA family oxidoreductase [Phycisphaerae bacterium]